MSNHSNPNQLKRNQQKEKSLEVIQFNCCGISTKLSEVKLYIYRERPDIVCFCETWLKRSYPKFVGYNNLYLHRVTDKGGLAMLIREDIPFAPKPIVQYGGGDLEYQAIDIHTSLGPISIMNTYNPNKNIKVEEFRHYIGQLGAKYIIIGDLNAHSPLWDARGRTNQTGKAIEDLLNCLHLGLLNKVETPTYIDNRTGTTSCLDLCLTSPNLSLLGDLKRGVDLGSDHFPIECMFGFSGVKSDMSTPKNWRLKHADWRRWEEELMRMGEGETNWFAPADAETYNNNIVERLIDTASTTIPQTSGVRRCNRATPWWDPRVEGAVIRRRIAKNLLWTHPTMDNLTDYRKQQATAKHLIIKKKKNSWAEFVSSVSHNTPSAKMWGALKSINGTTAIKNCPVGEYNTTNLEKAEMFLDRFAPDTHHEVLSQHDQMVVTVAESITWKTEEVIESIQPHEVKKAISMSKNTSPGEDRICNVFLKKAPENILSDLISLYNTSLYSGQIPEKWKTGITCAIPKPGKDPTLVASYRPITMLSCIGKIMERVIQRRLDHYLEITNVFPATQNGFRRGRSTTNCLAILKNIIHSGFQKKETTIVVYLDLQGAYDGVWHDGLIYKMKMLKINHHIVNWTKNYLSNRRIKVRVGSSLSNERELAFGLPQGAVISPILFNIMTHDIPKHPKIKTIMYADDITICSSAKDVHEARNTIQEYLKLLTAWLKHWKFKLNPQKCSYQVFSKKRNIPDINIKVLNQNISITRDQRVLGVIFDAPKLNFNSHVLHLKQECTRRLNVIRALSSTHWGSSRCALRRIYISYIRSKLEYGCVVFNHFSQTYQQKLNVVQNTALRCILGARKTSPIVSLEVEAYILPLDIRFRLLFFKWYLKTMYCPEGEGADELADETGLVPCTADNLGIFAVEARAIMSELNISPIKRVPTPIVCPIPPTINMEDFVSTDVQGTLPTDAVDFYHLLETKYSDCTEVYTDGSKLQSGETAAGMYVPHLQFTATWRLNSIHSVLGSELFAILKATQFILTYFTQRNQKFVILTDSRVSLYLIRNIGNPQYRSVVYQIQENLINSKCIVLQWVRGHVGVSGNEIADRAANLGHNNIRSPLTTLTIEEKLIELKHGLLNWWQRSWKQKVANYQKGKFMSDIFEKPQYRPWLIIGSRRSDCVAARLRIGHVGVGSHLHRFNMQDDHMCNNCGVVDDVTHFLMECSLYDVDRVEMLFHLGEINVNLNLKNLLGGGDFDVKTQRRILKILMIYVRATDKLDSL